MRHTGRLDNYLRQVGPVKSSAPELTHIKGPRRRRLTHKLNHAKARAVKARRIREAG
jgi:hypothetical protein